MSRACARPSGMTREAVRFSRLSRRFGPPIGDQFPREDAIGCEALGDRLRLRDRGAKRANSQLAPIEVDKDCVAGSETQGFAKRRRNDDLSSVDDSGMTSVHGTKSFKVPEPSFDTCRRRRSIISIGFSVREWRSRRRARRRHIASPVASNQGVRRGSGMTRQSSPNHYPTATASGSTVGLSRGPKAARKAKRARPAPNTMAAWRAQNIAPPRGASRPPR